jgi:GH18 family chitinase
MITVREKTNCLIILSSNICLTSPGYADHSGTPNDKENYTKLLQAIRYRLDNLSRETGKSYGLTAALPCNPQHMDNIEVNKLANILTEFNLMSYDLFGSWDPVTGANAPLYHQGFGNEDFNIHSCVENYVALGAPRERINIGLPFYGRSFKHATGLNQPHGGNDEANWPDDEGTPQYFNIYNKLPYMIQMRDNKGKTQYAYTKRDDPKLPPGGEILAEGLVSFDDERAICDKVHYAQQNNLGGFIIWVSHSLSCSCYHFAQILTMLFAPGTIWRYSRGFAHATVGHYQQEIGQSFIPMLYVALARGMREGKIGGREETAVSGSGRLFELVWI